MFKALACLSSAVGAAGSDIALRGDPQPLPPTPAGGKYNIIFLMCDSMDGRVLDPSHPISSYLEMPFMWSLATQGVNFANTYATSPQCVPSRNSMFVGRHLHETKAWANEKGLAGTPGSGSEGGSWELDTACMSAGFDESLCQYWAQQQNLSATLMDTLAEGGVNVAIYGKVDVGANVINRKDQTSHNPTKNGWHSRDLGTISRAADIRKGTKSRPNAKTDVATNKIHAEDWKMIDGCMKWLEENPATDTSGQPWMLYCSLNIPHPAYECNEETEEHVAEDIPLPAWFLTPKDYPETAMHPYDSYMSFSKNMMDAQGNFSKKLIEKNMRCWYAMCNQTDVMLGQVWQKAESTGNLANTLVVFVSDHGEMHMEHRQHLKNSMFEGASRVPLLVAGPNTRAVKGTRDGFSSKGRVVRDPVSLLDIHPTLVDATGGVVPSDLPGFSLMPYMTTSGARRPQDYVVSMYMSNMANTQAFMIRQGAWKYIAYGQYGPSCYQDYQPQLFNLERDPDELQEVSGDHVDVAAELDALLRSVVDYPAFDREVKMEEKMLYARYFANMSSSKLRTQFEKSYDGFDDDDMKKVQVWLDSVEDQPQPPLSDTDVDAIQKWEQEQGSEVRVLV